LRFCRQSRWGLDIPKVTDPREKAKKSFVNGPSPCAHQEVDLSHGDWPIPHSRHKWRRELSHLGPFRYSGDCERQKNDNDWCESSNREFRYFKISPHRTVLTPIVGCF